MTSTVMVKFKYRDPQTGKEFIVPRSLPCKDQSDAELTVKYYGMKTGALSAECKMEEVTDEESKQSATSITTAEAHQA